MIYVYYAKKIKNAHNYLKFLNEDVQKRILDNKLDRKQKQMITAEIILNFAFNQLNINDTTKIIYTPKPIVSDSNIFISKSHSDDYVAVAIGTNEIGIDVEKITDSIVSKKVLSSNEYNNYLTNKDKLFSFYWSIKEAYIKNIGFLSRNYNEIKVDITMPIKDINLGKVLNKHYYQTFINGYSLAVVSDKKEKVILKKVGEDDLCKQF